jgi:hypothetical protein
MIGSASNKILNNNGLYMRLKLLNNEQAMEITQLKDRIVTIEKELEVTTVHCDSYKCVAAEFYYVFY